MQMTCFNDAKVSLSLLSSVTHFTAIFFNFSECWSKTASYVTIELFQYRYFKTFMSSKSRNYFDIYCLVLPLYKILTL